MHPRIVYIANGCLDYLLFSPAISLAHVRNSLLESDIIPVGIICTMNKPRIHEKTLISCDEKETVSCA